MQVRWGRDGIGACDCEYGGGRGVEVVCLLHQLVGSSWSLQVEWGFHLWNGVNYYTCL